MTRACTAAAAASIFGVCDWRAFSRGSPSRDRGRRPSPVGGCGRRS